MNPAHLHLVLNHLPVILPLVGAPILAAGLLTKSSEVTKVAFWILIGAALSTIPAYLTGGPAEKIILNYPAISREAIHLHGKTAFYALVMVETAGALSLLILVRRRLNQKVAPWLNFLVLAISTIAFASMARTAWLGGEIRHEEIQTFDTLGP